MDKVHLLKDHLKNAEKIVVGAGAGLSTSSGFVYWGKRFQDNFADFISVYNYPDMYTAGFYPYETKEEQWAYWSRYIYINRYDQPPGQPYLDLLEIMKDKDVFFITTNTDHRFQVAGVPKDRFFYTQGDLGLWQCSIPCSDTLYSNEEPVREMVKVQKNMRIPTELVPYCPKCGNYMRMHLRNDHTFIENEFWHKASGRYRDFLREAQKKRTLFLELGVGHNTPGIIKYPFMQMTYQNEKATYVAINEGDAYAPLEIRDRSILISEDIGKTLQEIKKK